MVESISKPGQERKIICVLLSLTWMNKIVKTSGTVFPIQTFCPLNNKHSFSGWCRIDKLEQWDITIEERDAAQYICQYIYYQSLTQLCTRLWASQTLVNTHWGGQSVDLAANEKDKSFVPIVKYTLVFALLICEWASFKMARESGLG